MATTLLLTPQSLAFSKFSVSTKKVAINSQRATRFVAKASGGEEKNDEKGFTPFGFVTDNPSSRSAIQLPESPAEDGNVGQMLYVSNFIIAVVAYALKVVDFIFDEKLMGSTLQRIEDKGKEYGSYIKSGKLRCNVGWFVGSPESRRGTVVFLHGAPTQSYSYRVVMSQMSDAGFHCFAPDWIGFGFSDKPQPGYGFDYTEKEFHEALDKLLDVLEVKSPFFLVVQGFVVGSYGLTWALKNPSKISKLAILNTPLTVSSPVPGLFQQLRIPLFGEFTSQNAVIAERFIEAGSPYVLKLEKADVYRLPYLASSGPGFALLEAARKINFRDISSQIADGFASGRYIFFFSIFILISNTYIRARAV
ncbi:hypothetical protein CXB51_022237 [Gossypium anomalum]|uniref:AB hydrolase-1 domain-containing protein n=1 Tax=Gossypium anomalum TaxID=47600 RepID=A0A8J6CU22_9ROSI|nr:hypothetical protein CXB51_022237 [Gossypium anomalum]